MLQDNSREDEVERVAFEKCEIWLDVHVVIAEIAVLIVLLGELDHCLGDIDPVATIEGPGHCLGQSPDTAAEVQDALGRWRQASCCEFCQYLADIFLASAEELSEIPFPTLTVGITQDRPERIGLCPILPDPVLFRQRLLSIHCANVTGGRSRFRGVSLIRPRVSS